MPDVFTKEKRSQVMSKIRSHGSKIELRLKELLDKNDISYIYQPKIFGKPDFLVNKKITIFCDSSFWHGRNWKKLKLQLKDGYWQEHIYSNMKRDRLVNKTLKDRGYVVLRFWDNEILKNPEKVITKINSQISSKMI